jgi:hypothetical protein
MAESPPEPQLEGFFHLIVRCTLLSTEEQVESKTATITGQNSKAIPRCPAVDERVERKAHCNPAMFVS